MFKEWGGEKRQCLSRTSNDVSRGRDGTSQNIIVQIKFFFKYLKMFAKKTKNIMIICLTVKRGKNIDFIYFTSTIL